jgi:hypothetical protein
LSHLAPDERGYLDLVDLSEVGRECFEAIVPAGPALEVECDLATDLPFVLADPHLVTELGVRLARRAAEVVGDDWGVVTIATGVLGLGRTPLADHAALEALALCHHVYLEVHSTGPAVGPLSSAFPLEPFGARGFGPLDPGKAASLLAGFEGKLVIEPLATAGASVLLLLPYAAADFPI